MKPKKIETMKMLTKNRPPQDRKKLLDFIQGKSSLTGKDYIKYSDLLFEYERILNDRDMFNMFLKEQQEKKAYIFCSLGEH